MLQTKDVKMNKKNINIEIKCNCENVRFYF